MIRLKYLHERFTITIVSLLLLTFAEASHIAGGHLTYTCVGGGIYEVQLRVYRDCAGNVPMPTQVTIEVRDENGVVERSKIFARTSSIKLIPNNLTTNLCFKAPPSACIEYADYVDTLHLPSRDSGYNLAWHRCCRNAAIQNINMPSSLGSLIETNIPPNDDQCNSTPQIGGLAPIVFCINKELNFPLNVIDPDGDSLYFELCNVLDDDGSVIPFSSGFSSTYPMPSSPAFAVDPQTGFLTGTPNQLGTYALSICISEYRNGVLLNTILFDYQFNITTCENTVKADMLTAIEDPGIVCDRPTVRFKSQSNAGNALYWDFGDPTTNTDNSTVGSPVYTYPGPGTYTVMLIAEPNSVCADTVYSDFVLDTIPKPRFSWTGETCFENQNVIFEVEGNENPNFYFHWEFGPANIPFHSGRVSPPVKWLLPGKHPVKLTITDSLCSWTVTDTININNLTANVDAGPDTTVYKGDRVYLRGSDGIKYYWYANKDVEISSRVTQETSAIIYHEDSIVFLRIDKR